MSKKGVFDKAKQTGGVFEEGIEALGKALQQEDDKIFQGWEGKMVRLAIMVPESLRWAYKAKLSAIGKTYQNDIGQHIVNFVGDPDNK